MSLIRDNIQKIKENISVSCQKSGVDQDTIRIVAATKTVPVESIMEALDAGIKDIGENRVQEAQRKFKFLPKTFERHMIGHLQKNKVRKTISLFDIIQSVDSIVLAQKIDSIAKETGKIIPVFLEINVSEDISKYGFYPDEIEEAVDEISNLDNLKIHGLMTLGTFEPDIEKTRPLFRKMRQIKESLKNNPVKGVEIEFLSMGMSHDYTIAIEEGANMIRLGTAIFGERND